MKMDACVPDFESLLSFSLPNGAGLNGAAAQMPASAVSTLRAIAHDPTILNRAMLDYISLFRSEEATKSRETLELHCSALSTKHFDLIFASRFVNAMPKAHGATIHSLPVELLTHIFILAKNARSWRYPGFRQVCRLWRDVFDNTPSLWDDVSISRPLKDFDQLRRVLDRSKNHPLELTLYSSSCINDPLFHILSSEIARVRALDLYCSGHSVPPGPGPPYDDAAWRVEIKRIQTLMSKLIASPAPLLEKLMINSLWEIREDTFSLATFSRLRSVEVHDCDDMPFTSRIFKSASLTSLTLNRCTVTTSVVDMLFLLKNLPELQHLEVDTPYDSFDLPLDFGGFGHKSVSLPKLAYLDLRFPLDTIAHVISILDFPISTRLLAIGSFDYGAPSPQFTHLLNILDTAFRPHFQQLFSDETTGYKCMSIERHTDIDDEYRGFCVSMEDSPKDPFHFDLAAKCDPECQEEYMQILVEMLRWSGMTRTVTKLWISHRKFMRKQNQWQRLLVCFPALEKISIDGSQILPFFRFLRKAVSPSLATALVTIVVMNSTADDIGSIIRTLDKRVEAGQQKLRLELCGCNVQASELEQLKLHEGVQEVTWDGKWAYRGSFWGDDESDEDEEDESDDGGADESDDGEADGVEAL